MPLIDRTAPGHRDLRIDLLKGLALLMVFIDHLEDALGMPVLSSWTLRAAGPSDAAELFILFSGSVVGAAYSHRLARLGFRKTQQHALRRTGQLYGALLLAGGLTYLLHRSAALPAVRLFTFRSSNDADLARSLWELATLQRIPTVYHILVIYLILLPVSPGLVWIARRSQLLLFSLAALLYGTIQISHFRSLDRDAWLLPQIYFHPAAWQMLYATGVCLGVGQTAQGAREGPALPAPAVFRPSRRLIVTAMCLIAVGWCLRPTVTGAGGPILIAGLEAPRDLVIALNHKSTLGPIRLLHALAVACSVWALLPDRFALSLPAPLSYLATCGRFSLLVYLTGAVLTSLCLWIAQQTGVDAGTMLFLDLDGCLLLILTATLRARSVSSDTDRPPAATTESESS